MCILPSLTQGWRSSNDDDDDDALPQLYHPSWKFSFGARTACAINAIHFENNEQRKEDLSTLDTQGKKESKHRLFRIPSDNCQ